MAWPEGRTAIEYLLSRGSLEHIDEATVADAAAGNLARSERRLAAARSTFDDGDWEIAFSLAYTAYRMSAEALLARQALRSTGGEGGHRNVEEAVGAQFKNEIPAFAKPTFVRFRGTRHSAEYFDPKRPDLTRGDSEWALEKADEAVTGTRRLLDSGRLDSFRG